MKRTRNPRFTPVPVRFRFGSARSVGSGDDGGDGKKHAELLAIQVDTCDTACMTNSTATLSPERLAEILATLNQYEKITSAKWCAAREAGDDANDIYNVWEDVILGIAEYDEAATNANEECSVDDNHFVAGGVLFTNSSSAYETGHWFAEFDAMATNSDGEPLNLLTLTNEALIAYSDQAGQAGDADAVRTVELILASR